MEHPLSINSLPRLVFSPPDYEKRVLRELNQQRKTAKFCDVVLKVEETEIAAHRAVLCATIPQLGQSLDRKDGSVVMLDGLKHRAVEALVEFTYTSCLDVPGELVLSVYHAARTLEMEELEIALEGFIREKILPLDWLSARTFANRNDCPKLLATVDEFIALNIEAIYHKQAFLKLPRLQVQLTARNRDDKESFEPKALCEQAVHWIYRQLKDEDLTASALLEHTHIMYLTQDGLLKECTIEDLEGSIEKFVATDAQVEYIRYNSTEQLMKTENIPSDDEGVIILENNNVKKRRVTVDVNDFKVIAAIQSSECDFFGFGIIDGRLAAISIHQQIPMSSHGSVSSESSGYDDWSLIASMSRGRCSVGAAELDGKLYAVGGYDRGDCLDTVEFYDPQTNEWTPAAHLNCHRGRFEIGVVGGKMYAVGGSDGHVELSSTECYDAQADRWSFVAPMKYCRSNFGAASTGNLLYAVGGYQGSHNLKTAEAYDPETNEWHMISPMSCGRDNLCVEVLDGKLYAVGGYNGWTYFNTVEYYDPDTDTWAFTPPMKYARRGAGAGAIDGRLYVIGGYDGSSFLNSVECFNPQTNEWTVVASMNTPRHNVGVAVVGSVVYAVAGFNGSAFLKTMELYDPRNNKWNSFISSPM